MTGCYLSAAWCPLNSALVPLADNHAIGAALANKERDGLTVFIGYEGDIVAFEHIINRGRRLVDFVELIR